MKTMNEAWLSTLFTIVKAGVKVSPRRQLTYEILQHTMEVDMRCPVLTVPTRKMSYQFMAAEAYWILTGDNRVSAIAPYNKNIAKFSDDGITFYGAYGPKIVGQMGYVVSKLIDDPDTRQSGLTIWRENPQKSKDIPCTVAIFFNIRGGFLNCHVFMRSSDIWLGVPYDVFNFSMLSHLVCCKLNAYYSNELVVEPGTLYLTAASRHLYDSDRQQAEKIIDSVIERPLSCNRSPLPLFMREDTLIHSLRCLRDSSPGDETRWWEV